MPELLHFPSEDALKLEPHLPPRQRRQGSEVPASQDNTRPFVTLTFATSLDSSLSLAPGTRTALSGPRSKAMTHFLRSRHDAICVGVGTAVADDPGLNCRIAAAQSLDCQPRPVVVDPHDRWELSAGSKVLQLAREGSGLAPFIVTAVRDPDPAKRALLESHGGQYIVVDAAPHPESEQASAGSADEPLRLRFRWEDILSQIWRLGLKSIMIEGGGQIINSLLDPPNRSLIDSVIVTIAPTWLGRGGVVVSPSRAWGADGNPTPAVQLTHVSWHPFGADVVLCGKISDP